jgi:ribosome-associated translation inhibitor RaiA
MTQPVRITFRNLKHSDALEAEIRERVARLERYYEGILACRVLIEVPHRHHGRGNRYHLRVDLTVPGEEIAVSHDATLYPALKDIEAEAVKKTAEIDPVHKEVQVAIRETFDAARRRLQDFVRRQRGAVKTHAPATRRPRASTRRRPVSERAKSFA